MTEMKLHRELEKFRYLDLPICELNPKINGTFHKLIRKVESEASRKKIKLRPEFYLGTGWGCVNKSISIEIPFWFQSESLMEIEDEMAYDGVESESEIKMGLRHEFGHALNYAYKLYLDPEWKKLFGNFNKKYSDSYRFNPWSKRHVKHLPDYYAQKHPDEDWAETFAVWLTPGSNWRRVYAKTPALRKLVYVDKKINEIAGKPPLTTRTKRDVPIEDVKLTVREFYEADYEDVSPSEQLIEDVDAMKRIFPNGFRSKRNLREAWKLVHKYSPLLVAKLSDELNVPRHSAARVLRLLESICKTYDLRIRQGDEEEKIIGVSVYLSRKFSQD
ncbi:MAG TPA: putative zinc-binding metallopeptidase [Candidatus Kryptonia bacterium]